LVKGLGCYTCNDFEGAETSFSIASERESGHDLTHRPCAWNNLAVLRWLRGERAEARSLLQEILDTTKETAIHEVVDTLRTNLQGVEQAMVNGSLGFVPLLLYRVDAGPIAEPADRGGLE
jgi:hypothetical protein